MADDGDGDRLITLVLVGLVVAILLMVGALVITAQYVQEESGAAPDTEWELTRLNASHVRITHVGGEPVAASSLSVTVDGVPVHPAWSEGTVTEGDSVEIRVGTEASRLTLLWQHTEQDRDVLEQWSLSSST
jgi:FlaG/FlaF family flagellin (archaellin)